MPVIFLDVYRSTELVVDQGTDLAGEAIDARLRDAEDAFRRSDPHLWVGPQEGDGRLMLGHAELAGRLLRAALGVQLQDGIELRIGMAVGDITWLGAPWDEGSRIRGEVIHLAKRLETECPPGAVAINAGLYQLLERQGAQKLRALCEPHSATFKGIPGERDFWVLRGAPSPAAAAVAEPVQRRRASDDIATMLLSREDRLLGVIQHNATMSERLAASLDRLGGIIQATEQRTIDGVVKALKERPA